MPPFGSRSQTGWNAPLQHMSAELVEQQQVLALAVVRAADQRDVALSGRRCAQARCAPRRRRPTSSPMKVREEPVTPCTIEMLPASRLESCARNSVGRRSLISRSLRKASGFGGLAHAGEDRAVDRDVALAAAGGDDHVHAREQLGIALDARHPSSASPAA